MYNSTGSVWIFGWRLWNFNSSKLQLGQFLEDLKAGPGVFLCAWCFAVAAAAMRIKSAAVKGQPGAVSTVREFEAYHVTKLHHIAQGSHHQRSWSRSQRWRTNSSARRLLSWNWWFYKRNESKINIINRTVWSNQDTKLRKSSIYILCNYLNVPKLMKAILWQSRRENLYLEVWT